jgi:hypothetical protein
MPSYTLGDLMSIVTTNAGRRDDVDASTVSRLVNEAYFEIAFGEAGSVMQEKVAVVSTVSGEDRITLPTDFLEPITLSINNCGCNSCGTVPDLSTHTLHRVRIEELDAQGKKNSGIPRRFALFNNWIELDPVPNSAYSLQLRYRSQVTDLIEPTDVPSLSTPWRPAIAYKAEEKLHAMLQNFDAEAAANMRYLRYVSQLKTDEARRQSGQFRVYVAPIYRGSTRRRR